MVALATSRCDTVADVGAPWARGAPILIPRWPNDRWPLDFVADHRRPPHAYPERWWVPSVPLSLTIILGFAPGKQLLERAGSPEYRNSRCRLALHCAGTPGENAFAELFIGRLRTNCSTRSPVRSLLHAVARPRRGIDSRFGVAPLLRKYIFALSNEQVCERWAYDPYFQRTFLGKSSSNCLYRQSF